MAPERVRQRAASGTAPDDDHVVVFGHIPPSTTIVSNDTHSLTVPDRLEEQWTPFPPIADYAFLSDCEVSALVAPDGSVEWMCLPRPDSPSLFGSLLDRSAGFFRFGPSNSSVPDQRRYIPGTMVLETTWHTPSGWMTIEDLLVVGPAENDERLERYRRVPGDSFPRNAAPHRDVLQRARRSADRLPPALRLRPHRRGVELRRERLRAAPPHARRPVAALASSVRLGTGGVAPTDARCCTKASRRSSRSRGAGTPPPPSKKRASAA